jgi:hypothetical protein
MKGLGYAANPVLLLSHIRYLTVRKGPGPQLADLVAEWLVTGASFPPMPVGDKR